MIHTHTYIYICVYCMILCAVYSVSKCKRICIWHTICVHIYIYICDICTWAHTHIDIDIDIDIDINIDIHIHTYIRTCMHIISYHNVINTTLHCIALHDMTLHYIAVFRLDKAWDVWRNHHPEDHVGVVSILMSLFFWGCLGGWLLRSSGPNCFKCKELYG